MDKRKQCNIFNQKQYSRQAVYLVKLSTVTTDIYGQFIIACFDDGIFFGVELFFLVDHQCFAHKLWKEPLYKSQVEWIHCFTELLLERWRGVRSPWRPRWRKLPNSQSSCRRGSGRAGDCDIAVRTGSQQLILSDKWYPIIWKGNVGTGNNIKLSGAWWSKESDFSRNELRI